MTATGLLLAAGAGSRMGQPKALVHDDAGSWLQRGVRTLTEGGCEGVTVVLGAAVAEPVRLLGGLDGVAVVIAENWEAGMGASLRAGLAGLTAGPADIAVVSLVDLPDLVPDVVVRLLAADDGRGALARAAYGGVPGHPVLLGRDHWTAAARSAHGDQGARGYLVEHEAALVECGDLATGRDVDSR
ncbi:nucleotidyltransferase family protein [Nocardioides acrostichi]|uniref:Nucleotidyltransferase family protein n=1 Tax=Nocardioides acrostichi TaxID=2784339 RepID=A0A930V0C1_9ACTN|nr:nucleotidyltransferase family protein [Nocardioides acrostichi]MBF4161536.1 nucleotidyltransferase family protein [Nocardioides acrostichi]